MTPTPSGLVGRDRPLAELQALVEAALASRGGLVTLTGEAGIGKTTLAAAAADRAEALGATVAWGACWEGAPPFWPWLEALAALGVEPILTGGDRPGRPAPPAARFERFHAVSSALLEAAGSPPLVLVLDDLHWADPASVELAAFHARRIRRSRQLLIATYRDVEVPPGDPRAGPIARLAAEGGTLPLGGLDARQVARLLAGVTGGDPDPELGASVQRRTGATRSSSSRSAGCWSPTRTRPRSRTGCATRSGAGWPASATRASGCWRPPRCSAPTSARRSWPGSPASPWARCWPCSARPPRPGCWSARPTSSAPGASPTTCSGRSSTTGSTRRPGPGSTWRWPRPWRRCATAGPTSDRPSSPPTTCGPSTRPGRPPPAAAANTAGAAVADPVAKAIGHSELAAQEAAAVLADEDAARHYRQALRLASETGRLEPPGRARLLVGLGEALRRSGDTAGARQAFRQAADLARDGDQGTTLARAAIGLHAAGVESGAAPAEVAVLLEEALAGTRADPALTAQVESALAQTLAWAPAPDPARAAAMAERAVATARTTGDGRVLASALLGRHNVLWGPDTPRERLEVLAELERLAGDDEELAAEAQLLQATALLELGDARATALLAGFARRASRSRLGRVRWLGRSREAMLAVLAGDLGLADRLAGEVRRLGDELQVPDAGHVAAGLRAGVDSLRGRPSQELLEAAERLVGRVSIPVTSPRAWMSVLLLEPERPGWVDAYAKAAVEVAPEEVPRDWMWTRSAVILAELNASRGHERACARWYDALAPYRERTAVAGGAVLFCGAVAHYLGLLAAATGRPEPARRHLEDAVAVHERLGARPWRLRSRLELARLLRDDPDRRGQAADLLGGVHAEAERLGLDGLAAAAAGLLGDGGPPAPPEFRRAGASWTLSRGGRTARLADAKGMHDLAVLLARPGQPVPAAELVTRSGGGRRARADLALGADAVLDDQARRAYRRRLQDLEREVAEAEDQGDPQRAEKARSERDAIAHELAAALGLGGRGRGLGDPSERARKAVTERIRYSLARIARSTRSWPATRGQHHHRLVLRVCARRARHLADLSDGDAAVLAGSGAALAPPGQERPRARRPGRTP